MNNDALDALRCLIGLADVRNVCSRRTCSFVSGLTFYQEDVPGKQVHASLVKRYGAATRRAGAVSRRPLRVDSRHSAIDSPNDCFPASHLTLTNVRNGSCSHGDEGLLPVGLPSRVAILR